METCQVCGESHEEKDCELEICSICDETLENCGCHDHDSDEYQNVITGAEWYATR
jgi:hypothetical protein